MWLWQKTCQFWKNPSFWAGTRATLHRIHFGIWTEKAMNAQNFLLLKMKWCLKNLFRLPPHSHRTFDTLIQKLHFVSQLPQYSSSFLTLKLLSHVSVMSVPRKEYQILVCILLSSIQFFVCASITFLPDDDRHSVCLDLIDDTATACWVGSKQKCLAYWAQIKKRKWTFASS